MSMQNTLKLAHPNNSHVATLERRVAQRHTMSGQVTALRSEQFAGGHRNCICSLKLMDMSDTGVGAQVAEPLPINSHITIFFPPHGPERGFNLRGRVVRCDPTGTGHQIGVFLENKIAA